MSTLSLVPRTQKKELVEKMSLVDMMVYRVLSRNKFSCYYGRKKLFFSPIIEREIEVRKEELIMKSRVTYEFVMGMPDFPLDQPFKVSQERISFKVLPRSKGLYRIIPTT